MSISRKVLFAIIALVPFAGLVIVAKPARNGLTPMETRGKLLVTVGGCTDCHTPMKMGAKGPEPDMSLFLSGHPEQAQFPPPPKLGGPWFAATGGFTAWAGPWGISYASNLTPDNETGMGIWTEDIFIQAMRTGQHYGVAREILPPMPWRTLSQLEDADLKAIYAYLRSIPPIKNHVPAPVPPGEQAAFE